MKIILLGFLAILSNLLSAQIITTFAGGGTINIGDGGKADTSVLAGPLDIVKDLSGNIYISDQAQHRIRKIDPSGFITTYAGTGTAGFSGDGGPASAATLNYPAGLELDSMGNLYVADALNNRIRKIDTAGIITTIAGNGTAGFAGDYGFATLASLNKPFSIYRDKVGNLLIADENNHRIRKIDLATKITTIAGTGAGFGGDGGKADTAKFNHPVGITGDALGNLYISDFNNFRVRKIDTLGFISTITGTGVSGYTGDGGPASLAKISGTQGLFADNSGNVYLTDFNNHSIRMINPGDTIKTIIGNGIAGWSGDGGQATVAQIYNPTGVTIDQAGEIFIADNANNRIRKVDLSGVISTIAGGYSSIGDGGLCTNAYLKSPDGVVIHQGIVYITDFYANRIRAVNSGTISTFAGTGAAGYYGDGGQASLAQMNAPQSPVFDSKGSMYFADVYNECVRKIDFSSGIITTVAGTGVTGYNGDNIPATSAKLNLPVNIAIDKMDNLYIADAANFRIRKVDTAGVITTFAGNGLPGFLGNGVLATTAKVKYPAGMTFDITGNMYFGDAGNNVIRKIDTAGIITTIAGTVGTGGYAGDGGPAINAKFNYPQAVLFDPSGNLYICDSGNNRIRKVDSAGTVTTVVGNGVAGFSGDGGLANLAQINSPNDFFLDTANGDLYIADFNNNRVRKVTNFISGVNTLNSEIGSFSVYPNPSSTSITLISSSSLGEIKICNTLGQVVAKRSTNESKFQFDISGLTPGLYIVRAKRYSVKLIKE